MEQGLRQLNANQRVQLWSKRIAACRNSGMTVKEWCSQEGLSEKTYYYWQHKLYRMVSENDTEFVEISAEQTAVSVNQFTATVRVGAIQADIYSGADEATLTALLRALKSC